MFKKGLTILACTALMAAAAPDLPLSVHAASQEATVSSQELHIRSGPGQTYPVQYTAKRGEKFEVAERNGDWVKVQLPDGKTGWAAAWLLSIKSSQSQSSKGTAESAASDLRMRTGPGTGYQISGTFPEGEKAAILEEEGSWLKISYQGNKGWVAKEYVSAALSDKAFTPKTGKITATALQVRKTPGTGNESKGILNKGETVQVTGSRGDWYSISYKGGTGWIHSDYIDFTSVKAASSKANGRTGTVSASSLNVRDSASANGKSAGTISQGTTVSVLEESGSWYKISFSGGLTGWVSAEYIDTRESTQTASSNKETLTILAGGTNIRSLASTSSSIIASADKGDTFQVLGKEGDWFKVALASGQRGYVAGWLTDTGGSSSPAKDSSGQTIRGKTIVLDPGHGGYDSGTIGYNGTLEKNLTLRTARLVASKLEAAGAHVIITRNSDTYASLQSRAALSQTNHADAFVSMHYDSTIDQSAKGFTCYYYNTVKDGKLASSIHDAMAANSPTSDRGMRFGNFHVIRENSQPSILIELGYLSNSMEELIITSEQYQEQAAQAIYAGLNQYFQ
ncbi:SH3 domain-containing protein [Metabacillus sp. GX 13764]|uniref:SH3 domain-containing protein n=1 Tax=Metabacillus kandeliae TaxID=2900151 RepID=UPI001E3EAF15|nr:SH3 domain-containing protein [Metabacillus kandeliae]MCD7032984.1 SH3 domain-containing protein [Metabacillus kandeliae]